MPSQGNCIRQRRWSPPSSSCPLRSGAGPLLGCTGNRPEGRQGLPQVHPTFGAREAHRALSASPARQDNRRGGEAGTSDSGPTVCQHHVNTFVFLSQSRVPPKKDDLAGVTTTSVLHSRNTDAEVRGFVLVSGQEKYSVSMKMDVEQTGPEPS